MRIVLGISVLLCGLATDPVAASDAKLERLGELIDLKKADVSTITVRNKTELCAEVEILGEDATGPLILRENVEPEGVAVFEVELAETSRYLVTADSCDSSLCSLGSLSVDLEPGATVELCVTQATNGGEESEGGCELEISEADGGGEETASLTREVVVLTCSSTGLFALACLGFFLGRPPRRPKKEPLQLE